MGRSGRFRRGWTIASARSGELGAMAPTVPKLDRTWERKTSFWSQSGLILSMACCKGLRLEARSVKWLPDVSEKRRLNPVAARVQT